MRRRVGRSELLEWAENSADHVGSKDDSVSSEVLSRQNLSSNQVGLCELAANSAQIDWQRQKSRMDFGRVHAELSEAIHISKSQVRYLYHQSYLPLLACCEREH